MVQRAFLVVFSCQLCLFEVVFSCQLYLFEVVISCSRLTKKKPRTRDRIHLPYAKTAVPSSETTQRFVYSFDCLRMPSGRLCQKAAGSWLRMMAANISTQPASSRLLSTCPSSSQPAMAEIQLSRLMMSEATVGDTCSWATVWKVKPMALEQTPA